MRSRAQWLFKSCPKCGGDLLLDSDADGQFVVCIQCGYLKYDEKAVLPPLKPLRNARRWKHSPTAR